MNSAVESSAADLWELLEAEREAARRADALALLTLQEMKKDALGALQDVDADERERLVVYARENLRRIRTLLSCYEGLLDIKRPDTYGASGRLRVVGGT